MRKVFAALLLSITSLAASAQTGWTLTEVKDMDRATVGFIYHVSAAGTQIGKNEKFVTGLRMICSTKPGNSAEPIIALYWNTLIGNIPQMPEVKVDGRIVDHGPWEQNGPLLMKSLLSTKQMMQAMKTGRTISFEWTGTDNVRRRTVFDLRDFNTNLQDFYKSCNL